MTDTAAEFTRTCAWSGRDTAGKHYILTSTEGQEIISEAALREPADLVVKLVRQVADLTRRVRQLEGDDDQGAAQDASPAIPRQHKRTARKDA
jgi:hypothetical protein